MWGNRNGEKEMTTEFMLDSAAVVSGLLGLGAIIGGHLKANESKNGVLLVLIAGAISCYRLFF